MILTLTNIETAMSGRRINQLDEKAVKAYAEGLLRDLYILAGMEPPLYYDQLDELANDLRNSFPHLTFDELKLAGKAGIAGELGEGRRPSYASIMRWADAYNKSAMVADARKIRAKQKDEPKRLTDEEGWRIFVKLMPESLKRRWEDIRTQGKFGNAIIPHVSAQLYDWLGEEGVLCLTDEQRTIASRKSRTEGRPTSVRDMIELMSVRNDSEKEARKALARARAKHYALEIWMQDLHRSGKSLPIPTKITRFYE